MDGQDWNTVVLTKKPKPNQSQYANSGPKPDVEVKIEAPKNLGTMISQGRTAKSKTQKLLASELGIAVQVLSRWETGKEIPSNGDISKIERTIGVKLPRSNKIKIKINPE